MIVIAGVPGTGKTTVAAALAERMECPVIGVSETAREEGAILGRDDERETEVVDLPRLKSKVSEAVEASKDTVIVEGHYAYDVVPGDLVSRAIILRRAPWVLTEELRDRGYRSGKIWENAEAELLDVPLVEAIDALGEERVCEVDTTGKTLEETVDEVLGIIDGSSPCGRGLVDWLGEPEARWLLEGG